MTRVLVAAGGGGDAVAAAVVDAALRGEREPAVVLTYAWERLIVDPVPGPRKAGDFAGLRRFTGSVYAVGPGSRAVAPAGSTLPRLAAELPHTFALLEPHHGVDGMVRQIREVVGAVSAEGVDVVDVGGDILARGDEVGLRSPLGDALVLAACARLDVDVRLLVAGAGLDGEIPAEDLRHRLGAAVHTLTAADVEPVGHVLEWHPSEATGMLVAAARGARGVCEVRDAGLPIPLTDDGGTVYEADLGDALRRNALARRLLHTTSLDEAERCSRDVCGFSEIDYERRKVLRLAERPHRSLTPDEVLPRLDRFEAEARARGVTHTTFRRLTEALGYRGAQREALRAMLVAARPGRYAAPLWRVSRSPGPGRR
ncbi:DUF1152 domain-containing protein [Streptomyces sp. NPDC021020]|uniref:DUF1152 domain-containing protein n=1 Tax=Streptomyces sp. NPDC021020 TaxID=3365109 RepID=UPI0037AE7CE4